MGKTKSKYLYSKPGEKGLEMFFEYRGEIYSVVRAFTYPESEYKQHLEEKQNIDNKKDSQKINNYTGKNVEEDLKNFFKTIEED